MIASSCRDNPACVVLDMFSQESAINVRSEIWDHLEPWISLHVLHVCLFFIVPICLLAQEDAEMFFQDTILHKIKLFIQTIFWGDL